MRISDWSSDVCSSDLSEELPFVPRRAREHPHQGPSTSRGTNGLGWERNQSGISIKSSFCIASICAPAKSSGTGCLPMAQAMMSTSSSSSSRSNQFNSRSEEHTSELQSLMRISYAVFCLKKKITSIHSYFIYNKHIYT